MLISTVVALTLSPVMCSLFLKRQSGRRNFLFRYINFLLSRGNNRYVAAIRRSLKIPKRMLAAFGLILIAIWALNRIVPTSFMPQEDQGYFCLLYTSTSLACQNNRLTSLDVSNNTALIDLMCYANRMTELDASTMSSPDDYSLGCGVQTSDGTTPQILTLTPVSYTHLDVYKRQAAY